MTDLLAVRDSYLHRCTSCGGWIYAERPCGLCHEWRIGLGEEEAS